MNKKLLFIIFLSGLLFRLASSSKTPSFRYNSLNYQTKKMNREKGRPPLLEAICSGNKRRISKKFKEELKNLSLIHLLTPSGLHLSSFFWFLTPFFLFIKRRSPKLKYVCEIVLLFIPILFFHGFYSLKRVALYKILKKVLTFPQLSSFHIFLLTFTLDFFWGSYQLSPFSFCYSFLFFGIIIASINEVGISRHLFINLYIGQIFIALYAPSYFYFIGPLIGFFVTSFFIIFFPFLLLGNFLYPYVKIPFLISFLNFFQTAIHFLSEFCIQVGGMMPSWGLIIFLLLWKNQYKKVAIFSLLFLPQVAYNFPIKKVQKAKRSLRDQNSKTFKLENAKILNIKRIKRGYSLKLWEKRCYATLLPDKYLIRCRKSNKK